MRDPLVWLQKYTKTKDNHWREVGASTPYRPFPTMPYFPPLVELFEAEVVTAVEKSRDLMLSWLAVGWLTHKAMIVEGREILLQSQKLEKAIELVDYAKILYDNQDADIKQAFPLEKRLQDQAASKLEFANGSRIIGIPEGADQVRSYHPWGMLMDECAFMPEAGEAYDAAVAVCQKILLVSSAGPGWFADMVQDQVAPDNQ